MFGFIWDVIWVAIPAYGGWWSAKKAYGVDKGQKALTK